MRSNSVTAALRFLLYFTTLRSLAWSSRSREHALTRLTRAEGADGHGDGAGNVTLHRSDSLHSTSHVAEPAEGSVRPHPLLAGELIDHSLSQQQKRRSASSSIGTSQTDSPHAYDPESRKGGLPTKPCTTSSPGEAASVGISQRVSPYLTGSQLALQNPA